MYSRVNYTFEDTALALNVADHISFMDETEIVNGIADGVMDKEYLPHSFDVYFWMHILDKFTDFDINGYSTDFIVRMIDDPCFVQDMVNAINYNQYSRIMHAAKELIDYKKNQHPLTGVFVKLEDLIKSAKPIIDTIASSDELKNGILKGIEEKDLDAIVSALTKYE